MVKGYFSNPVFLSVIILCLIFYSGVFNIPEKFSYKSLVPQNKVLKLEGEIMSSPGRTSSGKYYSAKFKMHKSESETICGNAAGITTVLIPAELVEMYFPGKLYTKGGNNQAQLFETGGYYKFEGQFKENIFTVKKCSFSRFNNPYFGKLDKIRAESRLHFKRLMYLWKDAGGLLLALLCGAREYTDTEVSDAFRNAGLSHILALSGMHLSMFSAIALFFGKRIGRKKVAFVIRIIALICFLWFAGFSPSLTRAFICSMLTIIASAASVDQPDMILILCFSFLLQSIMSPMDIHNYGFILSYGALFGILIASRFFYRLYSRLFPRCISASLGSSTGAQIFTLPVSLKLFGSFSPVGIIATTAISPLITVFIYSGLVLIVICLIFPPLASCSGILLNFEYTIIKYIVSFFAKAPRITI